MMELAKMLAEAMKQGSGQQEKDDWAIASEPMNVKIADEERKQLERFVLMASPTPETNGSAKSLTGLKTGTILDAFFLNEKHEKLEGIPLCGQVAITGLSGSGKSILIEEMAVKVASQGIPILYVTGEDIFKSETPRLDLQSRLIQKAKLLGLDWNTIQPNIFALDTVKFPELREWKTFAEAYRYTCEAYKIALALIDSVTVLETSRFQLKYRVIELVRYNQLNGVTALFVNQRSEERDDISGMSGGYNLDYQYDSTIIIDFTKTHNFTPHQMLEDLGIGKNEFVRYARVLDSRLCGYDRRYHLVTISDDGFIRFPAVIP
jgi:hypothetical protein